MSGDKLLVSNSLISHI